jgi:hypothetical protein
MVVVTIPSVRERGAEELTPSGTQTRYREHPLVSTPDVEGSVRAVTLTSLQ